MHYMIPGPVMAVALVCVLGWAAYLVTVTRYNARPQTGTSMKLLCGTITILLLYVSLGTDWVGWEYPNKGADVSVVTIPQAEYDLLIQLVEDMDVDLEVYKKSISK